MPNELHKKDLRDIGFYEDECNEIISVFHRIFEQDKLIINKDDIDFGHISYKGLVVAMIHVGLAEYLVTNDLPITCDDEESSCTPLYIAVTLGLSDVVDRLLSLGAAADISSVYHCDYSMSTLVKAAYSGNILITKALLKYGVNVNGRYDGRSALYQAAHNGTIDVAKVLIEHGADVNLKDSWGDTPLFRVVGGWDKLDFMSLLIDNGANVNMQNYQGTTPLMVSCGNHASANMTKLLIDAGADVNLFDSKWNTALIEAVSHGNCPEVQLLVDAGAKIDHKNRRGFNALELAEAMASLPDHREDSFRDAIYLLKSYKITE